MTKTCTKCGETKSLRLFYKHAAGKHGRAAACKLCKSAYRRDTDRARAEADPNYWRGRSIWLRYGITLAEYEALLASQEHRCAVCARELGEERRPHLDHDHATRKIRAFLCQGCNSALGFMDDDPTRIALLLEYARHHAG